MANHAVECKTLSVQEFPKLATLVSNLIANLHVPFLVGGEQSRSWVFDTFFRADNGVCIAAVLAGEVIGWICAVEDYYSYSDEKSIQVLLWDVALEFRGRGIGKKLLDAVMKWGSGNRLLIVGVNPDSSKTPELAYAALTSKGFKEFERTYYLRLDKETDHD